MNLPIELLVYIMAYINPSYDYVNGKAKRCVCYTKQSDYKKRCRMRKLSNSYFVCRSHNNVSFVDLLISLKIPQCNDPFYQKLKKEEEQRRAAIYNRSRPYALLGI